MTQNQKRSTGKLPLSPLRYPGAKRRLAGFLEMTLRLNNLKPRLFVEPFAGGASISLYMLVNEIADEIVIADRDPLIAGFWKTVFFDTNWLINAIDEVDVSIDNWHYFKQMQPQNTREQALKGLFLNRTSFSGILAEGAGPIGGKEQRSQYDIGCRFPKETLVSRIRKVAEYKDQIAAVWECDWKGSLQGISRIIEERSLALNDVFLYLDPPFFLEAKRLYRFFFEYEDHRELRDELATLRYPWLLSYDIAKPIEELYRSNGNTPKRIETIYSVAGPTGPTRAKELIITNLAILPEHISGKQPR
jgi:DNA adenine methylase